MSESPASIQFTVRGLLVVTACVAIVTAILTPLVVRAREAARRVSCQNNLKQLALAMHNYESAFKRLPNAMGGTGGADELQGNLNRLSGLIGMVPFIEASPLFDDIASGRSKDGVDYPSFGPAPWIAEFSPWRNSMPKWVLRCPSAHSPEYEIPTKNYAFCIGDAARNIHAMKYPRGMFAPGYYLKLSDVTDGLANTIAMAEIGTLNGRALSGQCSMNQPIAWLEDPSQAYSVVHGGTTWLHGPSSFLGVGKGAVYEKTIPLSSLGRGGNWVDGAAVFGLTNTILPPNSPSVAFGNAATSDGFYSAGSYHPGGANVALGDGSVTFISNQIDVGDLGKPVPTDGPQTIQEGVGADHPYGVWGALGTASGSEGFAIPE